MKALLAQLTPAPGGVRENARRAAAVIESHPEADLVAFPELFLCGYDLAGARAAAVDADGPELGPVAAACAAAGTAAVVGFAERSPGGAWNSAACLDADGTLRSVYRKLQLFGAESDAFERGESLVVLELAGRRLAPMICFDVEFPEVARAAAVAGADLLLTISANMAPFGRDHRIHVRARALENRLPHLYVNRSGAQGGLLFVGESRAVRPDGGLLAEAGGGEELLRVEVPEAGADDSRVDYLALRPVEVPVRAQASPLAR